MVLVYYNHHDHTIDVLGEILNNDELIVTRT